MRLRFSIIGAVLLAGTAAIYVNQHLAQTRLARENAALRLELEKSARVDAENERLSRLGAEARSVRSGADGHMSELLRLRGEVALLRRQAEEARALAAQSPQTGAVLAAGQTAPAAPALTDAAIVDYWPRNSWRFQGYATPDAALETQFHAASRGDLTNFLASVTDKMKEIVERAMAGKSETEIAAKFNEELESLQSVRVLGRQLNPDDTALLTVDIEGSKPTSHIQMLLKKIGSDWKLAEVIHK